MNDSVVFAALWIFVGIALSTAVGLYAYASGWLASSKFTKEMREEYFAFSSKLLSEAYENATVYGDRLIDSFNAHLADLGYPPMTTATDDEDDQP